MNALYLDLRGTVHDPVGGLPDLKARRVRFIGDASSPHPKRITSAALRYFRFHAVYGDDEGGLDSDAMAAIASTISPASLSLSVERDQHPNFSRRLPAPKPEVALGRHGKMWPASD